MQEVGEEVIDCKLEPAEVEAAEAELEAEVAVELVVMLQD